MPFSNTKNDGLSVTAYIGDGAVLLAFDLDETKISNLAGFSIQCITPNNGQSPANTYFLTNLLNFNSITSDQQLTATNAVGSDKAPFQTFHWVHFPSEGPGQYRYNVYASYFKPDGTVQLGPMVTVNANLSYQSFPNLEVGFTRGYVSSQAYANRFKNAEIRPQPKSMNFDTMPYQQQYQWLGAHARKLVFDFLNECLQDDSIYVDVFSYDFDEPDIINELSKMGPRVRVLQDDASLHTGPSALEPLTADALQNAGAQVKKGHFLRFAHDKVIIQKKNGKAVKVLTGSANFSIRGLYVQANSILVFNDPDIAGLYEQAFETAFGLDFSSPTSATNQFAQSLGSQWYDINKDGVLPPLSVSFAPHGNAAGPNPFSLDKVSQAIESSSSSVFFAVMEMSGAGQVMNALENLGDRTDILSLGTIQMNSQLQLLKPGVNASFASFSFLNNNISKPFQVEWNGGPGQVIHHKFVVCDFNGKSPAVFCGSSNLSAGGEEQNGDNLIAIYDQKIATLYAVEAIRLFDHYKFRSLHQQSSSSNPLVLDSTDQWAKSYYDTQSIKFRERRILSSPSV